jgi:glycerol-3-phosphate dehydrogenase
MAGLDHFSIGARRGEYLVFDKELDGLVTRALFPIPTPLSKGIKVIPALDGNVLVGPTAEDLEDKGDVGTTAAGLSKAFEGGCRLVPELKRHGGKVIASYAGLRAVPSTGDFVIRGYEEMRGFINAAGIDSPGLTAAPAIAELVIGLLEKQGLELKPKATYRASRRPIDRSMRELSVEGVRRLVSRDPAYGHVICRCEHVTEGEIVEAIRRGATTLDGIKFRTRAGAGRCQGGFCTPRVLRLLARELGVRMEDLTKRGVGSVVLPCGVKSLLRGGTSGGG